MLPVDQEVNKNLKDLTVLFKPKPYQRDDSWSGDIIVEDKGNVVVLRLGASNSY